MGISRRAERGRLHPRVRHAPTLVSPQQSDQGAEFLVLLVELGFRLRLIDFNTLTS